MVLITASLVSMSLSTVPTLPPFWRTILTVAEVVIVVLFTVEYVLRIWTAEDRWGYIRSPFGLVDLLALLPFYLTLMWAGMIDLRSVRALRLLRVFRVFKVGRYNTATARLGKALRYARDEALVFLFATLVLLYIAAMGIHHFEYEAQPEKFESAFSSLWWAVVTLTTVGYGDAYPITVGGRIFTFLVLICGMGIVAVPAGLIASGLSRALEDERATRGLTRETAGS
jgi:voltage-gated potassium channel